MASTPLVPGTSLSRKRQSTRARLLDAAYEIFARDGVGAASVDAISEQAGFTRGAFYSNFETKNDLLAALSVRENQRRLAQIQAGHLAVARATTPDPAPAARQEVIERFADEFLAYQNEDDAWLIIEQEVRLLAMRETDFGRYLTKHQRALDAELERVLVERLDSLGLMFTIAATQAVAIIVSVYTSALVRGLIRGDHDKGRQLLIDAAAVLLTERS